MRRRGPASDAGAPGRKGLALSLLAIGFVSLLGQVALLRELNVAFFGSELTYVLALGVWLLGTAAGALGALPRWRWPRRAGARGERRGKRPGERPGAPSDEPSPASIARLFLAAGLLLVAAVAWARAARRLLGGVPGAFLPFPVQIFAMALALLPVSFALGLLFQWAARRAVGGGRTLAAAYALESAGALAGGAAATLLLRLGLPNLTAALLCGLVTVLAARPRGWTARAWGVALLAGLALTPSLDRLTTGWLHPGLRTVRDTPYGRVALTVWDGQVNSFVNDALAYETGGTAAEEFVTLAALQHPAPRRILVLGGGPAGLAREALRHRPEQVTSVELDELHQRLLLAQLPDSLRAPLADPRVRLATGDPRRLLAQRDGPDGLGAGWDLILVGMPEPASGQANRFYTREFFTACARRLAPGGVLALRLPLAENYWTPQLVRRTASIERALGGAFRQTLLLPGTSAVLLAADGGLTRDPRLLAARYRERGLANRLVTPPYVEWLATNERVDELARQIAEVSVPVNSDARPVCYQYTLMLWLSRFYPALAWLDPLAIAEGRGRAGPWARIGGLALLGLAWLLVRRRAWRRAVVVGAAGGLGMVAEALLLLAYQARRGVLYQDLGLLLMAFMGGLALGAAAVAARRQGAETSARRVAGAGPGPAPARDSRWLGLQLLGALALAAAGLSWRLRAGVGLELVETAVWLLAFGALTAAIFANASRQAEDQARAIGPLYGADLIGGCAGSLAASLLLIPLVGLANTALLMAGVALAAGFWEIR